MGVAEFGNSAFVDIGTGLCELAKVDAHHIQSSYISLLVANKML